MKNVIPINFDLASDRFANGNGEKQIQHKSHHWDVFPNLLFVGVCWDPLKSVMDLNSLINAFPLSVLSTVFIITEDSKYNALLMETLEATKPAHWYLLMCLCCHLVVTEANAGVIKFLYYRGHCEVIFHSFASF